MMSEPTLEKVNASEMIFIADITERDVYRIDAENLLPHRSKEGRFDELDLLLANFYFHTEGSLSKAARLEVMHTFVAKFEKTFRLGAVPKVDLVVPLGDFEEIMVSFARRLTDINSRVEEVRMANSLVSVSDLFDGEPVFVGTRVPVRTIAAFLAEGASAEYVREQFPSVTNDMIRAAPLWAKTHPAKGRPRKFGEINPDWKLKSTETVKLVRR